MVVGRNVFFARATATTWYKAHQHHHQPGLLERKSAFLRQVLCHLEAWAYHCEKPFPSQFYFVPPVFASFFVEHSTHPHSTPILTTTLSSLPLRAVYHDVTLLFRKLPCCFFASKSFYLEWGYMLLQELLLNGLAFAFVVFFVVETYCKPQNISCQRILHASYPGVS